MIYDYDPPDHDALEEQRIWKHQQRMSRLRASHPHCDDPDHPGCDLCSEDDEDMHTEYDTPEKIDESEYMDALNASIPIGYQRLGNGETFKVPSDHDGMSTIYACVGSPSTYWRFVGDDTLNHAQIMARVLAEYRK